MADVVKVDIFAEDRAHEAFLEALIRRVLKDAGKEAIMKPRSSDPNGRPGHDVGLVEVLRGRLEREGTPMEVRTHAHSAFAGALGAALWSGFRRLKLEKERDDGR